LIASNQTGKNMLSPIVHLIDNFTAVFHPPLGTMPPADCGHLPMSALPTDLIIVILNHEPIPKVTADDL
jgi:hypothetical protein